MKKTKVIVLDVDGTLTNGEKRVTPETKNALLKAQNMGALLVLASGRPTSGLMDLAMELNMNENHGLLCSYNGSKVVDSETMEVLFNETMNIEEGKAVLTHMKKFKVIPMIDKDDYMYVNDVYNCYIKVNGEPFNIINYESRGGKFKLCEVEDLSSFVDFPLNKILTAGDSEYLQEHYSEMMEPFKDDLCSMFTAPFFFEFTAKGIDKAKALESVLYSMGYKRDEVIAFGDGHNDISMIKFAGTGIAMGNSVEDLKAVADKITLSNEEDGIAHVLNKYLKSI